MKKIQYLSPVIVPLINTLIWVGVFIEYFTLDGSNAQNGRIFAGVYIIISLVHIVVCLCLYMITQNDYKKHRNINRLNTIIQLILIIIGRFHILIISGILGALCVIFGETLTDTSS